LSAEGGIILGMPEIIERKAMHRISTFLLLPILSALLYGQSCKGQQPYTCRLPPLRLHESRECGRSPVLRMTQISPVSALRFSPLRNTLASAGTNGTIYLWNAVTGKELRRLEGHQTIVNCLAFAPSGTVLASGGEDRTVRFWDVESGKQLRCIPTQFGQVYSLVFSTCGRDLAISGFTLPFRSENGKSLDAIDILDVASGKVINRLEGHDDRVYALAFSPDGKWLASGGRDGSCRIWEWPSGREVRQLLPRHGSIRSLAFSPDSERLALTSECSGIRQCTVATGTMSDSFMSLADYAIAFSPDGKSLASTDRAGATRVLEVATGKQRCLLAANHKNDASVACSPDGKRVASAGADSTLLVWDLFDPAPNKRLRPDVSLEQILPFWSDLSSAESKVAYQAICAFAAAPKCTVPFLETQVRPITAAMMKDVAQLIEDLDSQQFKVRRRATEELAKLGDVAGPAVRSALVRKPSLEVRRRLELLEPAIVREHLRTLRTVELLELIGDEKAKRLLRSLATGAQEALQTREAKASLERLTKRVSQP
jgi:WD40 repeat protein